MSYLPSLSLSILIWKMGLPALTLQQFWGIKWENASESNYLGGTLNIVLVQLLSHARLFATPWTTAHQASLSYPVYRSLLRFTFSESMILPISSSATLFILCLLSFPESSSFPMSHPFTSGSQSIRTSASVSVLPKSWLVKLPSN